MECISEILPIFGEASVSSEPGKCALDHPSARQGDESAHIVGALDDLQSQAGDFGDGIDDLMGVIATVGPDQLEPWMAFANLVEHQSCAVAILDTGRMDHDPDRQPFGINERVKLTTPIVSACRSR